MTLVPVDPKNEASVVSLLQHAAQWLAEAVHRGEPSEIAAVKAQMATAAEATKQLNLSKDIQLDAQEMVRRAEYALGKAIRRGQAEGTIAKPHVSRPFRGLDVDHPDIKRLGEFVGKGEWNGSGVRDAGINALADTEPSDFADAIAEAKTEGNLSRANVVRKIKDQQGPTAPSVNGMGVTRSPALREQRADLIADLATQGYSSRQMPSKVGVTEETVKAIARDFDIDIPADRSVNRTRRISPALVVENTATALEGLAMGVELIDCGEIDPALASQWVDSLTESMRALNRFVRQLKEQTQ